MHYTEQLDIIREKIINSKKPIMFFDCDADGGTSYLQLKKLREDLRGYPMSKGEKSQEEVLQFLDGNDLIVLFDTPAVHDFFFDKIKDRDIVWVDHHPNEQVFQANKYGITHFNPLNFNKLDSRPSCYWAYLIARKEENLQLAVLGSVTDYYILDIIKDLYNFNRKIFNLIFNGLSEDKREELFRFISEKGFEDREENYKLRVEWVQYLVFETNIYKFRLLFDFIYKMEYEDTLKAIKILEKTPLDEIIGEIEAGKGFLFEDLSAFMKKLKKLVSKNYIKNKEKEFIFVEHRGKTSFNRHLIDELLYKCKKAKVIETIFKKQGSDLISGSIRGRDGYAIIPLMVKSLESVEGQGGGHPNAGGFAVSKKDFSKFQNRFEREITQVLQ